MSKSPTSCVLMILSWSSLFSRGLFVVSVLAVQLVGSVAAGAVLTNPSLTISEGRAVPDGWQLSPAGTALSADTVDVPKGVQSALRLVAGAKPGVSGQLT